MRPFIYLLVPLLLGIVVPPAQAEPGSEVGSPNNTLMPEPIKHLIETVDALDAKCRVVDGVANDSCSQSRKYVQQLNSLGWCYGTPDQPEYDRSWVKCNPPPAVPDPNLQSPGVLDWAKSHMPHLKDTLLPCNSPALHKLVQDAVTDDVVALMGGLPPEGTISMGELQDSHDPADPSIKRTMQRKDPRVSADDIQICRPQNGVLLPSLVIETINPSTGKLGGAVAGYGAGGRVAIFGDLSP
jgi:hypothetical protein